MEFIIIIAVAQWLAAVYLAATAAAPSYLIHGEKVTIRVVYIARQSLRLWE